MVSENSARLDLIEPFSGFGETAHLPMGETAKKIQTPYVTAIAVQKPRSISRVASNVLTEASIAGSAFYYRWTVTDKSGRKSVIQGPSIDLAMCLIRNYGNCVLDIDVTEELSHYIFRGTVIDLENGFTCPRLFRQRKHQAIGKFDSERQEDISFQIGQSKALRNAIVRSMPAWLVDKAIDEAYNAELSSIKTENIATARAKCITFFETYGITAERIENKIGRKADNWTKEDIVELRANATAIKEGRITARELFPDETETPRTQDDPAKVPAPADEYTKPAPVMMKMPEPQSEPEPVEDDNPWEKSKWFKFKSPGLKAYAELHRDTFAQQDIDTRLDVQEKWSRARDLGDFPFDTNGHWIGFGDAPAPEPAPEPVSLPKNQVSYDPHEVNEQFAQWVQLTYPAVAIHQIRNFLAIKGAKGGIPVEYYCGKMMENGVFADQMIREFEGWHEEKFKTTSDQVFEPGGNE